MIDENLRYVNHSAITQYNTDKKGFDLTTVYNADSNQNNILSISTPVDNVRNKSEEIPKRTVSSKEADSAKAEASESINKANYISNNWIVININNKGGNDLNHIVDNIKKISMMNDNVVSVSQI